MNTPAQLLVSRKHSGMIMNSTHYSRRTIQDHVTGLYIYYNMLFSFSTTDQNELAVHQCARLSQQQPCNLMLTMLPDYIISPAVEPMFDLLQP